VLRSACIIFAAKLLIMTKRRDLKKAIDYLSGDLMMETLLCSLQPKFEKSKLEEIMSRVVRLSTEFRKRAQHPDGNTNKQLVKQYYKTVREDFDTEVDAIYTELMSLNPEKSSN
jgi:hypothetical protein